MNRAGGRFVLLLAGLVCAAGVAAQDSFNDPRKPLAPQPPVQPVPSPSPPPSPAVGPSDVPQPTRPQAPAGQGPDFGRVAQLEGQDFGVPATPSLHGGAMHGPTPTTIPGGRTISTETLYGMMQGNPQGFLLLDVLGGPQVLPNAMAAAPASAPGSFDDDTQRQFGQFLTQTTGGNAATPMILYCQSTQCWMSYNAALRAINLGYTQVLWYRGGLEAWQAAGLPTQPAY